MVKAFLGTLLLLSAIAVRAENAAPDTMVKRGAVGYRSAIEIEALTNTVLDELKNNIQAGSASDEDKAKAIARVEQTRTSVKADIKLVKKALVDLGTPYAVVSVVVTGAAELIPIKIGHGFGVGLGWQGELGFISTIFSSGFPRSSFVALSGPLFEVYPEVNVTQNKLGWDAGIHVKFILANIVNSAPIVHASDLEGWYVGGGFDSAGGPSLKIYGGGCFNRSAAVQAEYPDDNFLRAFARNCNTIMVSGSRSFSKNAPPISIPLKPFRMWMVDSNNGDGWVP